MVEWNGAEYDQVSTLQRSAADQSLAALALSGSERVLDVGCGDGYLTSKIASRLPGGLVVGVDPSRGMLRQALTHTQAPLAPRFVRADARHLPFGEQFDAAVSFNALHWVPQQQDALAQIRSVLRHRGWAFIQMVCAGKRQSLEAVAMDTCASPAWSQQFDGFAAPFLHAEPSQFESSASHAGLTVTSSVVSEQTWDFGSCDRFERWCAVGMGAWTDRLRPQDRAGFVDDVIQAYELVSGRPGLFHFTQLRATLSRT